MKRKNLPLGLPVGIFMFIANAIVLCIGFVAIVIFETHALREVTNRQTNMNLHVFAETICFFSRRRNGVGWLACRKQRNHRN